MVLFLRQVSQSMLSPKALMQVLLNALVRHQQIGVPAQATAEARDIKDLLLASVTTLASHWPACQACIVTAGHSFAVEFGKSFDKTHGTRGTAEESDYVFEGMGRLWGFKLDDACEQSGVPAGATAGLRPDCQSRKISERVTLHYKCTTVSSFSTSKPHDSVQPQSEEANDKSMFGTPLMTELQLDFSPSQHWTALLQIALDNTHAWSLRELAVSAISSAVEAAGSDSLRVDLLKPLLLVGILPMLLDRAQFKQIRLLALLLMRSLATLPTLLGHMLCAHHPALLPNDVQQSEAIGTVFCSMQNARSQSSPDEGTSEGVQFRGASSAKATSALSAVAHCLTDSDPEVSLQAVKVLSLLSRVHGEWMLLTCNALPVPSHTNQHPQDQALEGEALGGPPDEKQLISSGILSEPEARRCSQNRHAVVMLMDAVERHIEILHRDLGKQAQGQGQPRATPRFKTHWLMLVEAMNCLGHALSSCTAMGIDEVPFDAFPSARLELKPDCQWWSAFFWPCCSTNMKSLSSRVAIAATALEQSSAVMYLSSAEVQEMNNSAALCHSAAAKMFERLFKSPP